MANVRSLARKAAAVPLATASDLSDKNVAKVAEVMNRILADAFVLFLKTRNFHWHVSGKHFRDYHLLLDEQAADLEASIDPIAERVRKIGAPTVHSLAQILELTQLRESEGEYLTPRQMFDQLIADNKAVIHSMRKAHEVCDENDDVASASLLENLIDASERRLWFLYETNQNRDNSDS
jgi:starvation-inducible DNA-binding protein